LGHNLDLGKRVSLAQARKRVHFRLLLPTLPSLRRPDAIYVGSPPPSGHLSLVYAPRRGLPRTGKTGIGLLITEFLGQYPSIGKWGGPHTTILATTVGGSRGVWIEGAPHVMYYFTIENGTASDTIRLAHNVLLWTQGAVTLRIEGSMSEEEALAIGNSMKRF
jgi:hypothetical protein